MTVGGAALTRGHAGLLSRSINICCSHRPWVPFRPLQPNIMRCIWSASLAPLGSCLAPRDGEKGDGTVDRGTGEGWGRVRWRKRERGCVRMRRMKWTSVFNNTVAFSVSCTPCPFGSSALCFATSNLKSVDGL